MRAGRRGFSLVKSVVVFGVKECRLQSGSRTTCLLLVAMLTGCAAPVDPALESAVNKWFNAYLHPELKNQPTISGNWQKAWELLSPATREATPLADFNREQWNWIQGKSKFAWPTKAVIEHTQVEANRANVDVLLDFERPDPFGPATALWQRVPVVVELERQDAGWQVVSLKERTDEKTP